jgi:hypothetical protein
MSSVYFVRMHNPAEPLRDFGFIKVGITSDDISARIAQLQTGNPFELVRVHHFDTTCAREVEHFIHRVREVKNREWLRCSTSDVPAIVEEAVNVARRIEARRAKELALISTPSNGQQRRPTQEEVRLHRKVRDLYKVLVPARLRRTIAEKQLKAATGISHGIEGIVNVRLLPARIRFSPPLAEVKFPEQVARCRRQCLTDTFTWRRVPRPFQFPPQYHAAKEAAAAARASAEFVLQRGLNLQGWTARTVEIERIHEEFLRTTETVIRHEIDLAELQTEFTIRLGEFDAIDPICSCKRAPESVFDVSIFQRDFPAEAAQCAEPVAPRLGKRVYPTRSYR